MRRPPQCTRSPKVPDRGRLGDSMWTPVRGMNSRNSLRVSSAVQSPPRGSPGACQSPEPFTARSKVVRSTAQLKQCRSTDLLQSGPSELRSCSELMSAASNTSQISSAMSPPQICSRVPKGGLAAQLDDIGRKHSGSANSSTADSTRASTRTPSPRSACGRTPTRRSPTPRARHRGRDGRARLVGDLLSYHFGAMRDRGISAAELQEASTHRGSSSLPDQLHHADQIIAGKALERPARLEDQLASLSATVSEVRAATLGASPGDSGLTTSLPEARGAAPETSRTMGIEGSERPARLEDRLASLSATVSEVRAAVEHVSSSARTSSLSCCSSLVTSTPALALSEARAVVGQSSSSARTGTSLSCGSSLAASTVAPALETSTEISDYATAADIDAVYHKSEELVRAMLAVDCGEEVQHQWAHLMQKNEDYKERIARIEHLVARRASHLASGEEELRLCRAVRGLCVGSQKPSRRWSVTS